MLEMKTTDTLKRQENFGNYTEITKVPATIMKTIVSTENNGHSSPTFMEETKSSNKLYLASLSKKAEVN